MSDNAPAANRRGTASAARSGAQRRVIVAAALLLLAALGAASYYQFAHQASGSASKAPQPLPFYLEVKPFIVSMHDSQGQVHSVQLGVQLLLPSATGSNIVAAMMPAIADRLRLTLLADTLHDVTTPAGIDRLRQQMTDDLNRMLQRRLGDARIATAAGGHKRLIRNVYFSQLILQ